MLYKKKAKKKNSVFAPLKETNVDFHNASLFDKTVKHLLDKGVSVSVFIDYLDSKSGFFCPPTYEEISKRIDDFNSVFTVGDINRFFLVLLKLTSKNTKEHEEIIPKNRVAKAKNSRNGISRNGKRLWFKGEVQERFNLKQGVQSDKKKYGIAEDSLIEVDAVALCTTKAIKFVLGFSLMSSNEQIELLQVVACCVLFLIKNSTQHSVAVFGIEPFVDEEIKRIGKSRMPNIDKSDPYATNEYGEPIEVSPYRDLDIA